MDLNGFDISAVMATNVGGFTLSKVLYTVLIAIICYVTIRLVEKLLKRLLGKSRLNERLRKLVTTSVKTVLYIIAFIIVADYLGVNMSSMVALLSVGSLGVTLAAEDILGNMAGGLIIFTSHPFAIGDFVEANGTSGTVKEINLNHTRLSTPDGLLVMLPNKELANSKVINYTALGLRRVVRKVTASYDAPTEDVKNACMEAMGCVENVLAEPAPSVYLSEYGASSIEYSLFCWTKPDSYWQVYYGVGEALRKCFNNHGVEMTYNHLNVHIVDKGE